MLPNDIKQFLKIYITCHLGKNAEGMKLIVNKGH